MLENNIKNLIKILEESSIDEMEVSTFWGKQIIRIRKKAIDRTENNIEIVEDNSVMPSVDNDTLSQNIKVENDLKTVKHDMADSLVKNSESAETIYIKAPLVGTFYISPKPGDPPLINEGDTIKKGQIICIIEAMKIFNEIESEFSGKVNKILIKDSTPVEYDQDLIVISPD